MLDLLPSRMCYFQLLPQAYRGENNFWIFPPPTPPFHFARESFSEYPKTLIWIFKKKRFNPFQIKLYYFGIIKYYDELFSYD